MAWGADGREGGGGAEGKGAEAHSGGVTPVACAAAPQVNSAASIYRLVTADVFTFPAKQDHIAQ